MIKKLSASHLEIQIIADAHSILRRIKNKHLLRYN
jgi:hypothetical protein